LGFQCWLVVFCQGVLTCINLYWELSLEVKWRKISSYTWRFQPLRSLSCHTSVDIWGPLHLVTLDYKQGVLRAYSNSKSHRLCLIWCVVAVVALNKFFVPWHLDTEKRSVYL
jgi:hypothetical protein